MNARRFAADTMNSMCRGSSGEKASVVGGRLGPDQNGAPDEVTMSSGKL